ncbi:BspA family leucine-rich repeat surface protein [Leuconostoc falkenbergense]|uniref:BspA family leucine-rich repeat surface protein n=1 Tax=Leuconostoc falkenbergense TaxID=2766470 RepID=A0ABT7RYP5_9LACO|nr:BspA family leucine-rich repeat surface protein [Leuconostoc falkenbergense]MDM7646427.1 BspA family leucine-rich repeat surface protein [Leuconostoc falkenbergense]
MRVRKSLYITIITLLMTLSGPLQAVTASQLSEKDNNQPTTTMQLPNEGRSDLQELIQRVDANVGDDSAEEPSSETEADEHEEVEPPIEDSNLPEPEEQGNQKSVVQAKAPRAITTNTNGTSTWTFDSTTGLLSFGTGQLAERIDNNLTNAGVTPANVKTIRFNGAVDAPTAVDYLFANLTQLSGFTSLNNFSTRYATSMSMWFDGTSSLSTLDLSSWNVTRVTSFEYMFYGATSLTTLNLSDWGVGRIVTDVRMGSMFRDTSALTNLNLTNFKTTNVISMTSMFNNTGLTSLDLSSWDVTKVWGFHSMFSNATKLTTLNLSSWGVGRTATGVNMMYMFGSTSTSTLTNLNLTNFETTNVIDMSYMFQKTALTSLDLSSWDVTQVTNFYYMFYSTTSLTTLNLSSWGVGRTATNVDMVYMFGITSALTNLNLTNFKTTNVIDMNNMFRSTALTSLDLSGWDVTKVTDFDGMFRIATSLTTLNLSSWGVGRTATNVDMGYMFNRTSALTNLNLTNFKTTNVIDMSGMFQEAGLTSLDLSSWDVTQVTSFSGMFSNTTSLTTLNLTGWGVSRTATDVTMRYMFSSTGALTNLNLTNFKTTNVTNMLYMFYKTGLTSLDLSGWDVTKVTDFNGMFRESSLRILNLSGWNSSGSSVSSMFYKTTNLWKITLGEDIIFSSNPEFQAAPAIGTTIPGTSYKTTAASWQIVGTGTALNPKGAMVTTTEMYADRTEPVTYVWANKALAPTPVINTISSLTFGTLAASDFFNGNSPLATNMATGSVALEDLDNSTTYNVTVAQTSDWTTDGESATIAKSNLKIKYGANDLSTGASSFWSGTSATETKSIAFNHDDTKNFSIWLNPSAVLDTALLGKQLESELTWTLSETP